jgi:hypothetical protein
MLPQDDLRSTAVHPIASLIAKLLLALASTVLLGSETHGTDDHTLLCDSSGSLSPSVVLTKLI